MHLLFVHLSQSSFLNLVLVSEELLLKLMLLL
jgi:hypothetical protein